MARVGLLGLEPFVVSQVEHLDRELEVILLDAIEPEVRGQLELDVVVVNAEHAGSPQLVAAHPAPPVVVIDEKPDPDHEAVDDEVPDDGPIHLARPVSSPELLGAIDSSRGLPSWRRALRALTIEQDDRAIADRYAAVARTVLSAGVLARGAYLSGMWGLAPLVLLTVWMIGRALWWRLTPRLVLVDAVVVVALLVAVASATDGPSIPLSLLAAGVALEAGFTAGWWRTAAGLVVALLVLGGSWTALFGTAAAELTPGVSALLLLVVAAGAGGMGRRLWLDQTQTRSGELRQSGRRCTTSAAGRRWWRSRSTWARSPRTRSRG